MLLYLTTAPLLPPCLKIAVNYKCSLNVSSDPEMQVGVRRGDSASLRFFIFFLNSETLFLSFLPCFIRSLFFSAHPLLLLCLLHSPPLRFYFSALIVFFHISFPQSLARSYSSVVFLQLGGSEQGWRIRGLSSFPPNT